MHPTIQSIEEGSQGTRAAEIRPNFTILTPCPAFRFSAPSRRVGPTLGGVVSEVNSVRFETEIFPLLGTAKVALPEACRGRKTITPAAQSMRWP